MIHFNKVYAENTQLADEMYEMLVISISHHMLAKRLYLFLAGVITLISPIFFVGILLLYIFTKHINCAVKPQATQFLSKKLIKRLNDLKGNRFAQRLLQENNGEPPTPFSVEEINLLSMYTQYDPPFASTLIDRNQVLFQSASPANLASEAAAGVNYTL